MRCKICNSLINKPVWNSQLNDWEVCTTCLEIINDVFEDPLPEEEVVEDEKELDNLTESVYNILMDGQG